MADELGETQDADKSVLELTDGMTLTGDVTTTAGTTDQPDADGGDDEEVIVSFGDEAAPASEEAPEWVRGLRKQYREVVKENEELKRRIVPTTPEVGEKPTLESCEYDEERFEREFNSYLDRKASADAAKAKAQEAEAEVTKRYQAKVETYGNQKTELGVKDFDTAEAEVIAALSPAQQAILIHGAENKATLVYALGRHPEKLRQLASITDPIEFAFAASKLETQTKMDRRPRTSPESTVRGSAPLASGGGDKTLERLEAEAERTGNRTKVIAYKREQRAKSQR